MTGVAQVKVMSNEEFLKIAVEQFLGKTDKEIKKTILFTIEGHLRAIIGILTVEEIYKWRRKCAQMVQEVASTDLSKMGLEIMSFTLKSVTDDVQFLDSLGKTPTALVKKDADIGVAEAERDSCIKEAECQKESNEVKYSTDSKIEQNKKVSNLEKAKFDTEVNTALAIADLAYNLQGSQIDQELKKAVVFIDFVERKKEIEVEEKENLRKAKELMATTRLPAEAECLE